jgi:hypothetical protein
MRNAFGIFGLVCGVIVVVLVGRYGYKTTDVEFDAWVMAFLFAVIASFGLAGHVLALRLRHFSKIASVLVGIVAVGSLGMNLSNSLGAIAGRSDSAVMKRVGKNRDIRAAEAELKRLTGLRDAMQFQYTDEIAVASAKIAADAAAATTKAACPESKKPSEYCKEKQAAETAANAAYSAVTNAKAQTDRAKQLEADAKGQRDKLAALGPIVTENVQGSAIARLFRLKDSEIEFAATAQQFGLAAVVELIIIACLSAWEILGHRPTGPPVLKPVVEIKPEPEPETPIIPPAQKPKLIVSNPKPPSAAGSVKRILTDNLEKCIGGKVEFADLVNRYRVVCKDEGKRSVGRDAFIAALDEFCKDLGIKRRTVDGNLYLMGVQLVAKNGKEQIA